MAQDNIVSKAEPYFSVIITMYNSQDTIKRALESVASQYYKNFEIVLIDDASKDGSYETSKAWIDQHEDINITLIQNDFNIGVAMSRNIGVSNSKGVFIAFLDADDQWFRNKLSDDYVFLTSHTNVNWIFSDYVVYDSEKFVGFRHNRGGKFNFLDLIHNGNPIGLLTVVIRRTLMKKYEFKSKHHEDYRLWLTLAKDGESAYSTGNQVARYNLNSKSISANKFLSAFWTFSLLLEYAGNPVYAIQWFLGYALHAFFRGG